MNWFMRSWRLWPYLGAGMLLGLAPTLILVLSGRCF
jgi:hypothetical protein